MNKFKKAIYDVTRIYAKNYLTGNLGKVVEDDEKITCYVKRNKIKYMIHCFGVRKKHKEIAENYKLNKPISYVIDGFEIKKYGAGIYGHNGCEVIIKNCNFKYGVNIHVDGNCTLDNVKLMAYFQQMISANNLILKDVNIELIKVSGSEIGINFGAKDKIDVIDSIIGTENKKSKISFLASNEINVINSKICGKKIECDSKRINADEKSSLIATDKVTLKTDNFTPININAPTIVLNEEEISIEKKSILLKKVTDSLTLKRLELVNTLKKIKKECIKGKCEMLIITSLIL